MFRGKKYIIFDWDGTLANSLPMWENADKVVLQSFGVKPRETIDLERRKFLHNNSSGDIYEKYNQYLIDTYGIFGISAEDIAKKRKEAINSSAIKLDLKKDAETFLMLLKKYGFTISLATLSTREQIDFYRDNSPNIKRKTEDFKLFDGVILTKDDIENKKPNPEVYLKAIESLGALPSEVLVFEDSLEGVIASKKANLQTVVVHDRYNDSDRELISRYADFEIKSYSTLVNKL